jgi:NAD(P)-dependent dehydrogenase (short-subunit alcohol dehydrogenase family)
MRLSEKVAVITGGASGIGRATAELFAAEGARVVIGDIDDAQGAAVVEALRRRDAEAEFVHADVRREADAERLIGRAVERFGRLDILVNNAGVNILGDVVETTPEQYDLMMDTNVRGTFLCTRHAVRQMRRQGGGVIVNVASVAALVGARRNVVYDASKGAVLNMTRALAVDHAAEGIRVNCICPGLVDTPMTQRWLAGQEHPEEIRRYGLLQRPARAEEIAQGILFLASEMSSYMTGGYLALDGGFLAV